MCLINRQGRTNANSVGFYSRYRVGYKCGHCAECIKERRNEWVLRSYFESMDTFERNGYIYFDTLTYSDETLPHLSRFYRDLPANLDYSCFDYRDVRQFTNLLWTTINRKYPEFDCKRNMKFFLVSEYGHEDEYLDEHGNVRRGTFRPHYHILFYVKSRNILHPLELASLVREIWSRGNTEYDKVRKIGLSNFMSHNVIGRGYTKDKTKNILAVSNYVAKYVTKQGDFMDKVDERADALVSYLLKNGSRIVDGKQDLSFQDRIYNIRYDIMKHCSPFHRQSRGFGACALEKKEVIDSIIEKGNILIPDMKFVVKAYGCPLYYSRKLFYKTIKDVENDKYYWVLNDFGKQHYPKMMSMRSERLAERYWSWFQNLDGVFREKVLNILDGRTFHDLADYVTYYRGRIYDPNTEFVNEDTGEISFIPSKEQIINIDIAYSPLDASTFTRSVDGIYRDFAYVPDEFDEMFADVFIGSVYGEDPDAYMKELLDDNVTEMYTFRLFERNYIINEDVDYSFRDFDKLLCLFTYTNLPKNDNKEEVFHIEEDTKKRLQDLGIL